MTPGQQKSFAEIRRLLAESYADYFARRNAGHKRGEGQVRIHYPGVSEPGDPMAASGVSIYSYALGPSRDHEWFQGEGTSSHASKPVGGRDPLEAALEDVKAWHAEQMAWLPD